MSDGISATGLDDGNHKLGDVNATITNGLAYVSGTTTLCGSTATLDKCVQKMIKYTGKMNRMSCLTDHKNRMLCG